jgi:hypothetical protein
VIGAYACAGATFAVSEALPMGVIPAEAGIQGKGGNMSSAAPQTASFSISARIALPISDGADLAHVEGCMMPPVR